MTWTEAVLAVMLAAALIALWIVDGGDAAIRVENKSLHAKVVELEGDVAGLTLALEGVTDERDQLRSQRGGVPDA